MRRLLSCMVAVACLFVLPAFGSELTDSLSPGNLELKSAAQLAFGPDGIVFIADSHGAAIFAVDTKTSSPQSRRQNSKLRESTRKLQHCSASERTTRAASGST